MKNWFYYPFEILVYYSLSLKLQKHYDTSWLRILTDNINSNRYLPYRICTVVMQLRYHPFHMPSFCSNSLTMLSMTYVPFLSWSMGFIWQRLARESWHTLYVTYVRYVRIGKFERSIWQLIHFSNKRKIISPWVCEALHHKSSLSKYFITPERPYI